MENEEFKKKVLDIIVAYNKGNSFTGRILSDTPGDAFSLASRRFVTLSSNLTARPVSSVAVVGQRFYDTTNNVPIWYTNAGWRNSVGSIVAQNN